LSTWKCLQYALVCSLGSHTWKWPVGGVFIAPNTNRAVGEKLLLLCGTPDSPVVHRKAHCSMSGAPSHCPVRAGDRWRLRDFHTGQSDPHTGQSDGLFSGCHLELAVGLLFPGAPNSPACGHRTVRCATGQSGAPRTDSPQAAHLDFSWIFLMSSFEVLLSSIP
jgi:hypothetical protein